MGFLLSIWFAGLIAANADTVEKAPIFLGLGEQRALQVPHLKRYSLSGDAVRILPSHGDELFLKGVRAGTCSISVWKSVGSNEIRTIRVEPSTNMVLPPGLKSLLSQLQEVEVLFLEKGVLLKGEVKSLREARVLGSLLQGFPDLASVQVELSEDLFFQMKDAARKWIRQESNYKDIELTSAGRTLIVKGIFKNKRELERFQKDLRLRFPLVETDLQAFDQESPVLFFQVFLLELKRSEFQTFGIDLPLDQASLLQVKQTTIQNAVDLNIALNSLSVSGAARVLSRPQLVVRTPGEAELFAGGEFPYVLKSKSSSSIEWKKYGLILKLKITDRVGARIRLEVSTEVSSLDGITNENGVPGIKANRLKTQVEAESGVPLFLSGLLHEGLRQQVRGIPLMKDIPILGSLFSSEDYLNEQSELVAVLIPSHMIPPAPFNKLAISYPKGKVPPPRNWLNSREMSSMRHAIDFPWNALE